MAAEAGQFAVYDITEQLLTGSVSTVQWLEVILCANKSRYVFRMCCSARLSFVAARCFLPVYPSEFSDSGPLCIRDLRIQNERSVGCPPHLAVSSFSSLHLNCSCPFEGPCLDVFQTFLQLNGALSLLLSSYSTFQLRPILRFHCLNWVAQNPLRCQCGLLALVPISFV